MQAIQVHAFGGSQHLRLFEIPTLAPSTGEVVVTIEAAGVNPVDTYIRAGTYPFKPELPYTPGIDGAGIISKVGSGVEGLSVGDRVYVSRPATGTYAEECRAPADHVHLIPASTSFAEGAAIGIPYFTAYRAIFQLAKVQAGETVLVHGASGGVGVAALQLTRALGAKVIGTSSSAKGREFILSQGAHHALDHSSSEIIQEVLSLTKQKGVAVILEVLANKNMTNDLAMIALGGRIVVIGNRGSIDINFRDAMSRDASILGMSAFNATAEHQASAHAAIRAGLESGALRPVIHKIRPLAEAYMAHDEIVDPAGAIRGKIVLQP